MTKKMLIIDSCGWCPHGNKGSGTCEHDEFANLTENGKRDYGNPSGKWLPKNIWEEVRDDCPLPSPPKGQE